MKVFVVWGPGTGIDDQSFFGVFATRELAFKECERLAREAFGDGRYALSVEPNPDGDGWRVVGKSGTSNWWWTAHDVQE